MLGQTKPPKCMPRTARRLGAPKKPVILGIGKHFLDGLAAPQKAMVGPGSWYQRESTQEVVHPRFIRSYGLYTPDCVTEGSMPAMMGRRRCKRRGRRRRVYGEE